MRIKIIKSLSTLSILLMFIGCPTSPTTEGFTADMVQTNRTQITEGKIFVKEDGKEYRMDVKEGDEKITIIVDRESEKQKVIYHSEKSGREVYNKSDLSLSNNLFESFYYLRKKSSIKEKGFEVIDGYKCKEIDFYEKNSKLATAWVSDSLNWPLKIETRVGPKRKIELSNVKKETLAENLFQVPKGYRFTPLPEPKRKDNTKDKKPVDIVALKKDVIKKMEKEGIELDTKDGKIKLREIITSSLVRNFPDWKFFLVNREKKSDGENLYSSSSIAKAAVSEDGKNIYLLSNPEVLTGTENEMSLNTGLKMLKDQGIELNTNNKKDTEKFAKLIVNLYFRSLKVLGMESIGENEWAIYNKAYDGYLNGFIVKIDDEGNIIDLKYKLKIRKE